MTMTIDDLSASSLTPSELYDIANNAGEGFNPDDDIESWTLVSAALTTDTLSVYLDEDGQVVLVGTDGSGDDDSRWAVRPAAE